MFIKRLLIGFVLFCSVVNLYSEKKAKVHVEVPGSFSSIMKGKDLQNVVKLKVSGSLNVEDLKSIVNLRSLISLDLTNADIENNTIPGNIFNRNRSMQHIYLPKSLKSLGDSAFYLSSIEYIKFQDQIEEIGKAAFTFSKIEGALLPEKISILRENTFRGCLYLKTLVIPENVTVIEKGAIGSTQLNSLYCYAETPPEFDFEQNKFYFTKLYVSYTSGKKYKEHEQWSKMRTIEEFYIPKESPESKKYLHFNFMGVELEGGLAEFQTKLVNKGFRKGTSNYLEGEFIGKRCIVTVESNDLDDVQVVGVDFTEKYATWGGLKSDFEKIKSLYVEKYGSNYISTKEFHDGYYEGDGFELSALKMGKVDYSILYRDIYGKGGILIQMNKDCTLSILYMDEANFSIGQKLEKISDLNDI